MPPLHRGTSASSQSDIDDIVNGHNTKAVNRAFSNPCMTIDAETGEDVSPMSRMRRGSTGTLDDSPTTSKHARKSKMAGTLDYGWVMQDGQSPRKGPSSSETLSARSAKTQGPRNQSVGMRTQTFFCLLLVMVNANDVIVKAYSQQNRHPEAGPMYMPASVQFMSNVIGVLAGNIWLMVSPQSGGLKTEDQDLIDTRCEALLGFYNIRKILRMSTPAMLFTIAGTLRFLSLGLLSPNIVATMEQGNLMLCAVAGKVLLGKQYSTLQWVTLLFVTMSLLLYSHVAKGAGQSSNNADMDSQQMLGMVLMAGSTLLATLGGISCEVLLKGGGGASFYVQKAQMELAAAGANMMYCLMLEPLVRGNCPLLQRGLLSGWDSWTIAVLALNLGRSWLSGFIVMILDNLVFSLVGTTAMLVVYAEEMMFLHDDPRSAFKPQVFAALMCVAASVTAFTGATRLKALAARRKDSEDSDAGRSRSGSLITHKPSLMVSLLKKRGSHD